MQEDCLRFIEKRISMINENHGQACQQVQSFNAQMEVDSREKEGQLIGKVLEDINEKSIENEQKIDEQSSKCDLGRGEKEEKGERTMSQSEQMGEFFHQDIAVEGEDKGEVQEGSEEFELIQREDSQFNERINQEILGINEEDGKEHVKKEDDQDMKQVEVVNERVDMVSLGEQSQCSQYSEMCKSKQGDDIAIIEKANATGDCNGQMANEAASGQALEMIGTNKDNQRICELGSLLQEEQQPYVQPVPFHTQFEWLAAEVANSQNKFKRMQLPAFSPQFLCQEQDIPLDNQTDEQGKFDFELRSITRRLDYNLSEAQRECLKSVREEDLPWEEMKNISNLDREKEVYKDYSVEKPSKEDLQSSDQQVSSQLLEKDLQRDISHILADRSVQDGNSLVEDELCKLEKKYRNGRTFNNKYSFGNVSQSDSKGLVEYQIAEKNNNEEHVLAISSDREEKSNQENENQVSKEQNKSEEMEEREGEKEEKEQKQEQFTLQGPIEQIIIDDPEEKNKENDMCYGNTIIVGTLLEEIKKKQSQTDEINEASQGKDLGGQSKKSQKGNPYSQGIQDVVCDDIQKNFDIKENNNIMETNNNNCKNEEGNKQEAEVSDEMKIQAMKAQNIAVFLKSYSVKTRDEILQEIIAAEEANGDGDMQASNKRISKDEKEMINQQAVEQGEVEGINSKEEENELFQGKSDRLLRGERNNVENDREYGFRFNFMDNPMMKYSKRRNCVLIANHANSDGSSLGQQDNTREETAQFNYWIAETHFEDAIFRTQQDSQAIKEYPEDENKLTNYQRNSDDDVSRNSSKDKQLQDEQTENNQEEQYNEASNNNKDKTNPQGEYSLMNQIECSPGTAVPLSSHNNIPSAQKSHQKPRRKSMILGLDISEIESQDLEHSGSQYVLTNIHYSAHKKQHLHEKDSSNRQTPIKRQGASEKQRQSSAFLQASPVIEKDLEPLLYSSNQELESQSQEVESDLVFPHWTRRSIRISNKHKKLSLKDGKQAEDNTSNLANDVDYSASYQRQHHHEPLHGDTAISQPKYEQEEQNNYQQKQIKSSRQSLQSHEGDNPVKYRHALIDIFTPTYQQ